MDLRQVAHDLLRQVVVQLVASAGQATDERSSLRRRSLSQGCLDEGQRRRPSLGSPGKLGQDVGFERPPVCLAEQLLELTVREPKVADPELGELADGPQLRDGHRRLPSAGEDDREPIRSSGHDLPHDEPHVGDLVGQVEVVEDEGGSFGRDRWQFGDEGSDRVIAGRPAGFE